MEEKWTADFSKPENPPFDIKTESSYNAYLSNNVLSVGLKKTNCIAWLDAPNHQYQDQIIDARFRLDNLGGYASAGLMFRMADDETYYLALISSKGYFRFDAVKNNSPRPLIGWTEAPEFDGEIIHITIIAYGDRFIFLINRRWAAEISDSSISGGGGLGFVLASYESPKIKDGESLAAIDDYTCMAHLDSFSVDSRFHSVEEWHEKWSNSPEISAESRLRLAETLAVLGSPSPALEQITKAWERREEAARSVTATYTEMRTRKELLLAARMSFQVEQYDKAEEYINACLEQGGDSPEVKEALAEKVKILGELYKFEELKEFMRKNQAAISKDPVLYALLAQAHWKLDEYGPAALAWDAAFELDRENGIYAVNAANALELLDKKDDALRRFLEAGRIFLRQNNHGELAALVPRLTALGAKNWEARALAGKWAFSVEDYNQAETEFALAESLRRKARPLPAADPAVSYLRGLVLSIKDKHKEASRFFKDAVILAPHYGLFRYKFAENQALLSGNAYDPKLAGDLQAALDCMDDDSDGIMAHNAGRLLFRTGDIENADVFFCKALSASPDNMEFISSRLSCLLELGRYAEAEDMLTQARLRNPSAGLPEMFHELYSARRRGPPPPRNALPGSLKAAPNKMPAQKSSKPAQSKSAAPARTKPGSKTASAKPGAAKSGGKAASSKPGAVKSGGKAASAKPGAVKSGGKAASAKPGAVKSPGPAKTPRGKSS